MSVNSALTHCPIFIHGRCFVHGVEEEIEYTLTSFNDKRGRGIVKYGVAQESCKPEKGAWRLIIWHFSRSLEIAISIAHIIAMLPSGKAWGCIDFMKRLLFSRKPNEGSVTVAIRLRTVT